MGRRGTPHTGDLDRAHGEDGRRARGEIEESCRADGGSGDEKGPTRRSESRDARQVGRAQSPTLREREDRHGAHFAAAPGAPTACNSLLLARVADSSSGAADSKRLQQSVAKCLERRQLDRAQQLDLVPKLDTKLLEGPPPRLLHERECVGRAGAAGVLDEVRVPRRDLSTTDPVALEAAYLEHAAGGELVLRVSEDAAERALVRRLRRLTARLEIGDRRFDLFGRTRLEPELRAGNDLAVSKVRVAGAAPPPRRGAAPPALPPARPGADTRAGPAAA